MSAPPAQNNVSTSLKVFRSFLRVLPGDEGLIDASQINSRACYEMWLNSRGVQESDELAKKFYRTLSNHVSGVDGRNPFEPNEEFAILQVLRVRQRWPCFPEHLKFGCSGYRSSGYAEKRQQAASGGAIKGGWGNAQARRRAKESSLQRTSSANSVVGSEVEGEAAAAAAEEEEEEQLPILPSFSDLRPDDLAYAQWVINAFPEYASSCAKLNLDIWESVAKVSKYVILGRTPACTVEVEVQTKYAQDLCETFAQRCASTDAFVLVWDGLAKDFKHRFVAQSEASLGIFGPVVDCATHCLLEEKEMHRIVCAGLWVLHNYGKDYALPNIRMKCADGQIRTFDATLWLDPKTYYHFVLYGTLQ